MRTWGAGLLMVTSVACGCLDSDKEASQADAPVAAPPAEDSEEDDNGVDKKSADEKTERRSAKAKADSGEEAPGVKVTLGKLARTGSSGPGKPGAASEADPLAATAVGSKMSDEEVRKVAEAHFDDIGRCYEQESGDGAVRIDVHLTVGPGGEVEKASVEGDDAAETLKECVAKAVGTWEFPAPGGVVQLHFPFTLQPTG